MAALVRGKDPKGVAHNLCHVDVEPEMIHAIENSRVGLSSITTDQGDVSASRCNVTVNLEWAAVSGLPHHVAVSEHPFQVLGTLTTTTPRFALKHEHRQAIDRPDRPIEQAEGT